MTPTLSENGYLVLKQVVAVREVRSFRDIVVGNLGSMGQTRPTPHSWHLAGFERFAPFKGLYDRLFSNPGLLNAVSTQFGAADFCGIGLSDITVNRSQHWHSDLLRGPYKTFLEGLDPWAADEAPCIKALVYLQAGESLRIVSGSHRQPTPLCDQALKLFSENQPIQTLHLDAGDIVLMDIRSLHRGSSDAEMADPTLASDPKILVSSVFAAKGTKLGAAMKEGNRYRMRDWDEKYLPARSRKTLTGKTIKRSYASA